MADNRLEILRNMLAEDPANSFARYGLAMAYAGAGDHAQAVEEYRKTVCVQRGE